MISRPHFSADNLPSLSTKPMISDHLGIPHTSKGTHPETTLKLSQTLLLFLYSLSQKNDPMSLQMLKPDTSLSLLTSPSALFNQSLSLKYPTSYCLTNLSLLFTFTTTAKPGFPALTVPSLN